MKEVLIALRRFLKDRFNLHEDKADEAEIIENIKHNVHFKGPNLWTLIFAIMIASIGLNVNSTAVIIGAMLISPLMGPIMGIGLAVGINDFELLKKSIKNLAFAAMVSIITSSIYFLMSPIHVANSELLARTNPSVWDVFIGLFGGFAGIVAGTRSKKSTVIPGVAIATALMPPLCTAGFGIATGHWGYLFGALYLFFINSLFICVATFITVKKLRFQKIEFETKVIERRRSRYIWAIVIITVLPSIYFAYRIVERTIFETNAKNFVQKEFQFKRTQVINRDYKIKGNKKIIELLLVGEELPQKMLDSLKHRLLFYHLDSTRLIVHQGLNASQEIDLAQIKASILEDVFKTEKLKDTSSVKVAKIDIPIPDLHREFKSLYPTMQHYSLSQSIIHNLDSSRVDTLTLLTAKFSKSFSKNEREKLQSWLKVRVKTDSVKLVVE